MQDEVDGLARKLEVDRHRNQASPHDAVIGRKVLGAIRRENGDAVPAREPALHQRARDAISHRIELSIAELARNLLAAEIDDRDFAQVAIAANEVTEVGEDGHRVLIVSARSVCSLPLVGEGWGAG